jgi:hypothetical protein
MVEPSGEVKLLDALSFYDEASDTPENAWTLTPPARPTQPE